jgi:hypothetical protein
MKTKIEVSDALMLEAKSMAQQHNTTLRALVEQGLEKVLRDLREPQAFRLKDGSFRGQGLQPGQEALTWTEVRDMVYEGRGT